MIAVIVTKHLLDCIIESYMKGLILKKKNNNFLVSCVTKDLNDVIP